ncbi:MAG: AEC family transporter [Candidatus Omnitrophota bacterium]
MLPISFQTLSAAILQILLMGACGYMLFKKRLIDEAGLDLLTRLLMNFFLPIFMFYQLTQRFRFSVYPDWWLYPVLSFIITAVALVLSRLVLALSQKVKCPKEFISLCVFQNSGYIPLILVATLFEGQQAEDLFVYIFLFLIGFNLTMWSLGTWFVASQKTSRFQIREFFNPPLIALLIAFGLIALGWQRFVPPLILKPMKLFSQCVFPLAMIMVGGNLGRIQVNDIRPKEIIPLVLTKLILLPLCGLGIILLFRLQGPMAFILILETAVPSAISLSIISRHYQVEECLINQGLLFTHLASIVTIPTFLSIYNLLQ